MDSPLSDADRRVRLDPPTLHAPRGDVLAAVSLGGALVGFAAGSAVLPALGIAAGALGVASAVGALAYPWQRRRLHDLALRRRIRRVQERLPVAIGDARPGTIRVRGRVHVLRGVPLLSSERVAAYVARRVVRARCTCTEQCYAHYSAIRTEWAAGRFAIADETGVAVIDGGVVDLWPAGATLARDGQHALRHGDVVDVLGTADLVEAPDVGALTPGGYRTRRHPLGLTGTVSHPITIVLPPRRSTRAAPSAR